MVFKTDDLQEKGSQIICGSHFFLFSGNRVIKVADPLVKND